MASVGGPALPQRSIPAPLLELLKAPAYVVPNDTSHDPPDDKPYPPSLPAVFPPPASSPTPPFSPAAFLDKALSGVSPSASLPNLTSLISALRKHASGLEAEQLALISSSMPLFTQHSSVLQQQHSAFHALTSSYAAIRQSMTADLTALSPVTSSVSHLLSSSTSIQRSHIYLLLVQQCDELADTARQQAEAQPQLAAKTLLSLSRLYAQVKEEGRVGTPVPRLERLVHHRLLHLLHLTKARLTSLYADTLHSLHWPQTGQTLLDTANEPLMTAFTDLTETLLLLQVEAETQPSSSLSPTFTAPSPPAPPPPLWLFELLFSPIHVRFRYHFTGERPTNRLDKPEWYLSFATNVISLHLPFLQRYVQPLLLRSPLAHVDAAFALVASVVGLLRAHARASLPSLMDRPVLFRHLIDELLSFESRLRTDWDYPDACDGVVGVLVEGEEGAVAFERWLSVDKEWVNDRLQAMREMKDPWQRVHEGSDAAVAADVMAPVDAADSDDDDVADVQLDTDASAAVDDEAPEADDAPVVDPAPPRLVVSRSAQMLVALLSSITQRFTLLPSLAARLRFVQDLQYQLLDIYLEWLEEEAAAVLPNMSASIAAPAGSVRTYCQLANSLHYVESVLLDWSDSVTFIELRYYQAHSELPADLTTAQLVERLAAAQREGAVGGEVDGSVFDAMVANYHDAREQLIKGIVDAVIDCFDALTRQYRRLGHQDVLNDDDEDTPALSSPPAAAARGRAEEVAGVKGLQVGEQASAVSPSFVGALLTLKLQLLTLSRHLSSPLMALVWQRVASRVDFLLFSTTVKGRYFSASGARQLSFDLHALLLLFKAFTPAPSRWLGCVSDACMLLGYGREEREEMEREMEGLEGVVWIGQGMEERRKGWRDRWRMRKLTEEEVRDILNRRSEEAEGDEPRAVDEDLEEDEVEVEVEEEEEEREEMKGAAEDENAGEEALSSAKPPAAAVTEATTSLPVDSDAASPSAVAASTNDDEAQATQAAEDEIVDDAGGVSGVLAKLAAEGGEAMDDADKDNGDGWDVDL